METASRDDDVLILTGFSLDGVNQAVFVSQASGPEAAKSPRSGSGLPSPVNGEWRISSISSFRRAWIFLSSRDQNR